MSIPNNGVVLRPYASTSALNNKSKKLKDIERAIFEIQCGYKVLVLLRGVPGSGKSYLAKQIVDSTVHGSPYEHHILSTDDYFMINGIYHFESYKLHEAHGWNHNRAFRALSSGTSPVIIDNTNIEMWEMKPYASMATDFGYIIKILEPDTHWSFDYKELTKRNKHGLPEQKIMDMICRFNKNITTQKLLSAYVLNYKSNQPPQYRSYPPINKPNGYVSPSVNTFNIPLISQNCSISKSQSANVLNYQQSTSTTAPVETINLMDFDDSLQSNSYNKNKPEIDCKFWNDNPIDEILMWGVNNSSEILKPNSSNKFDSAIVDNNKINNFLQDNTEIAQEHRPKEKKTNVLGVDIESAWGINEKALRSWDIVTPLSDPQDVKPTIQKTSLERVIQTEASTNTSNNIKSGTKVLYGKNRDINVSTPKNNIPSIPKKIMIDKSCLTDDLSYQENLEMDELTAMFPVIPKDRLRYCYTKCKCDLELTIELLLEGKDDLDAYMSDESQEITEKDSNDGCSSQSSSHSPVETVVQEPKGSTKQVCHSKEQKQSTSPIDLVFLEFDDFDAYASGVVGETIELNLGEQFVSQLENKFGNPNIVYPKGFQPIVQVPISLARQMYTFYIESVYQQMDAQKEVLETLVQEDEAFAKKLQEEEQQKHESNALNSATTMFSIGQNDWSSLTPDTLASKLTKQKLISSFPSIEQNVLLEIFQAHDNNYQDTIESLLTSSDFDLIVGTPEEIKKPPIDEHILKEMKEEHERALNEEDETRHEGKHYREEANKHLRKREDLYRKAQTYHQKGLIEVAQFYIGLASQYTKSYDTLNLLAAQTFLDEHSKKLQDFYMLDLHFLYVKEAIPALDVFIDRNINLLKGSNKHNECLQIITGRGNRSQNGISKIRPAVIERLKQRGLHYVLLNPGLLKIKIYQNSMITSDIP